MEKFALQKEKYLINLLRAVELSRTRYMALPDRSGIPKQEA